VEHSKWFTKKFIVAILVCLLILTTGNLYAEEEFIFPNPVMPQHAKITPDSQMYIVGAGLAGLATAVYAIQDANFNPQNIHIIDEKSYKGGALYSEGGAKGKVYSTPGARLLDEIAHNHFRWNFLKRIPNMAEQDAMEKLDNSPEALKSYTKFKKTISDDMEDYFKTHHLDGKVRLIDKDKKIIDAHKFGLTGGDLWAVAKFLYFTPERKIQDKRIDEVLPPHFFKTNFWAMYQGVFAFQQWHSAIECQRYMLRFFASISTMTSLHTEMNPPYDSYNAWVVPTVRYLKSQGVDFVMGTRVVDVDFRPTTDEKTITMLHCLQQGVAKDIPIRRNDFTFISIGSKVSDVKIGTMHKAPVTVQVDHPEDGAFLLWQKMAAKQPELGNPLKFTASPDHSEFVIWSCTTKGKVWDRLVLDLTGNKRMGEQHEIVFPDSPWRNIFHVPWQPFVPNQTPDTTIIMGMCEHCGNKGEFVKKPMWASTGEEILTEFSHAFGWEKELPEIIKNSEMTVYYEPYVTSMFLPRNMFDRPKVVPNRSTNLAFIGEYTEMPEDTVFMVSYSTKSAQLAVHQLFDITNIPITPPVVHNQWNPYWFYRGIKAVLISSE
jgi:oleate hydratase